MSWPRRLRKADPHGRRHHVNNWLTDRLYRRAVAETCRRPAWLSATIRCFSANDQRRRAPVEITSRRKTFELGVWSIIRLCLHPHAASRKTVLGGGIQRNRKCASAQVNVLMLDRLATHKTLLDGTATFLADDKKRTNTECVPKHAVSDFDAWKPPRGSAIGDKQPGTGRAIDDRQGLLKPQSPNG
jgi:hypothetical protein